MYSMYSIKKLCLKIEKKEKIDEGTFSQKGHLIKKNHSKKFPSTQNESNNTHTNPKILPSPKPQSKKHNHPNAQTTHTHTHQTNQNRSLSARVREFETSPQALFKSPTPRPKNPQINKQTRTKASQEKWAGH